MSKIMPLDILSSIKGATPADAVEELFLKVKNAVNEFDENAVYENYAKIIEFDVLREDTVKKCEEDEIEIIRQNFPLQKDGYLVVPRIIEE